MTEHDDVEGRGRAQRLIGEDYELRWIIGRGGMSTVWLAVDHTDPDNPREVAVKALRPEFSNAPEFLSRFRNEAAAAESLDSDNVVRTFDYREVPDPSGTVFCFIVMEYVRGESLADLLAREGSLEESLALDVLEQAAHGLAVIHRKGLVHRDIKPGNLMVTEDGATKIADFGIAKAAEAVPLTRTGMVVGTAQYVSPEQAQGKEVTAASDVYSLGVVAYETLSGRRPFTGDSSVSVVLAHINNPVPALPNYVSPQTRELVTTALRKDPAGRYADGDELALAVSAVRRGEYPPQPKSAGLAGRAPEPSPTATTEALASVAQPTTVRPQAPGPRRADVAAGPVRHRPALRDTRPPKRRKEGGGFGTGLLIALVIALALGVGVLAAASGLLDGLFGRGGTTTPTTQEETIVTETVTSSEEPEVLTTTHREPETEEEDTPERETTHRDRETSREPLPEPPSQPEQPTQPTQDGGEMPTLPDTSEIEEGLNDLLNPRNGAADTGAGTRGTTGTGGAL